MLHPLACRHPGRWRTDQEDGQQQRRDPCLDPVCSAPQRAPAQPEPTAEPPKPARFPEPPDPHRSLLRMQVPMTPGIIVTPAVDRLAAGVWPTAPAQVT